jgi:hypothetical protein
VVGNGLPVQCSAGARCPAPVRGLDIPRPRHWASGKAGVERLGRRAKRASFQTGRQIGAKTYHVPSLSFSSSPLMACFPTLFVIGLSSCSAPTPVTADYTLYMVSRAIMAVAAGTSQRRRKVHDVILGAQYEGSTYPMRRRFDLRMDWVATWIL